MSDKADKKDNKSVIVGSVLDQMIAGGPNQTVVVSIVKKARSKMSS